MFGYTGWLGLEGSIGGKSRFARKEKGCSEEMVGYWLNIAHTCKQRQINVIFINVDIDVYYMTCCF